MRDLGFFLVYAIRCLLWNAFIPCMADFVQALSLQVDIVIPGFVDTPMPSTISLCGPAFATGISLLNEKYFPIMNVTDTYLYDSTAKVGDGCPKFADEVVNLVSRWLYQTRDPNKLTVFVTSTCISVPYLNQLTEEWNLLLITSSQSSIMPRVKDRPSTWITTNLYPLKYYGAAYLGLFKVNNWTSVYLVEEIGPIQFYSQTAGMLANAFRLESLQFVHVQYAASSETKPNFVRMLTEFVGKSRVMLFFGSPTKLRELLIQASARNMTSREFVYIVALPFPYKRFGAFKWKMNDQFDDVVREAYRSVLQFTAIDMSQNSSANFTSLASIWTELYKSTPFYRNVDLTDEPPIPFLASTHAVIEMLGQVLNETVTSNPTFDLNDGAALAKQFWNRSFHTTAGQVVLDDIGERIPMMSFAYHSHEDSRFEVFLRSEISQQRVLTWRGSQALVWYDSNHLPPNEPLCGYDGLRGPCRLSAERRQQQVLEIPILTLAALLVTGVSCAAYLIRKRKFAPDVTWWTLELALLMSSYRLTESGAGQRRPCTV